MTRIQTFPAPEINLGSLSHPRQLFLPLYATLASSEIPLIYDSAVCRYEIDRQAACLKAAGLSGKKQYEWPYGYSCIAFYFVSSSYLRRMPKHLTVESVSLLNSITPHDTNTPCNTIPRLATMYLLHGQIIEDIG